MSLQEIAQSYGDPVKPVVFTHNGVSTNLKIRRLPFIEIDNLRAATMNDKGNMDPKLSAGHRSRLIAAAVTEEDGQPLTEYQVGQWPDDMVLALVKIVQEHNGMDAEAVKAASKNSEATPANGG